MNTDENKKWVSNDKINKILKQWMSVWVLTKILLLFNNGILENLVKLCRLQSDLLDRKICNVVSNFNFRIFTVLSGIQIAAFHNVKSIS